MFLRCRGQVSGGESQFPPEVMLILEPQCGGRVLPPDFVEILGFIIIHGALDTTEASVVIIE